MPATDILATMSMGPALIGEEIDDYVDLTPGDMFHHIAVYLGTMSSVSVMDTRFQVCEVYHPMLKNCGDTFRNIPQQHR